MPLAAFARQPHNGSIAEKQPKRPRWGFVGSKAKNTSDAAKAAGTAGDVWLWMATDADTKLVPCWHVGGRHAGAANEFIDDLASRLANRVQITTDGHKPYLEAIDRAFGGEVDYAMLVKLYGPSPQGPRRYKPRRPHRRPQGAYPGQSGPGSRQHVLCREEQSQRPHALTPHDTTRKCLLKEG